MAGELASLGVVILVTATLAAHTGVLQENISTHLLLTLSAGQASVQLG